MRKQRTTQQNKALHKYCELLATALNDAGYGVKDIMFGGQVSLFVDLYKACINLLQLVPVPGIKSIIEKINISKLEIDIPWSKDRVKELIWKPVQEAMTGKSSTTEMNTVDPSEIYLVVDRHISELTGCHVEWPTEGE